MINETRADDRTETAGAPPSTMRRFSNSLATTPLRIFLASVFLFAGYAKLTYPGFFDPNSSLGFHSAVQSARDAHTPLGGLMGPLADHTSLFGHVTAFAEIAIGLGLLVGLLTRVAAVGGMLLTGTIVLSINWPSVREYNGNGGWFTSVDLAMIAALSVFLLGGAGPLSLDATYGVLRRRRRARQEAAEPPFNDREEELEDSRRRLRGEPGVERADQRFAERSPDQPTAQLPSAPAAPQQSSDDSSLWNNNPR